MKKACTLFVGAAAAACLTVSFSMFGNTQTVASAEEKTYAGFEMKAAFTNPNKNSSPQYFYTFVHLRNYSYDEVWLTPPYSHDWTAEQPIEISVK